MQVDLAQISGHSDLGQLSELMKGQRLKSVLPVHGDPGSIRNLTAEIEKNGWAESVVVPGNGQEVKLF